jgi:nitroreductase
VRAFSERPVPREVIEHCVLAAGTAPNGANLQPWRFVVVSDPEVKRRIREGAEREDREFYERLTHQEWIEALAPIATSQGKPYFEVAPYVIAIFAQTYTVRPDGSRLKHYYVAESVGIATGMLITAIHHAGLSCLTHTPSPMGSLNEILERPLYERPFLLLVVGYPAEGVEVPAAAQEKKALEEIAVFV